MKYLKYVATALCLVACAATFTSCGDDDSTSSGSSSSSSAFDLKDITVSVYTGLNGKANPFLYKLSDEEEALKKNIKSVIDNKLATIASVTNSGNNNFKYNIKKEAEVKSAIQKAMVEIELTLKSQRTGFEGNVECSVIGVSNTFESDNVFWSKTFEYTPTLSSFTDNNGLIYYPINDKEAGVVQKPSRIGESSYSGDIVIPETVTNNGKTYTVTAIGPQAFYYCKITSIKLPKTITTIYEQSFESTSNLTSVTIPGSVKEFKNSGNSITSYMYVFGKSNIKEVIIEEGVTSLCDYMFYQAANLQKVTLPSTITEIPNYCFTSCSSLDDLTINSTITNIGAYAFYQTSLNDQTLAGLKFKNATLAENAFESCQNLKEINIPEGVATISKSCFSKCKSVTSVTIPASVTSMEISVFAQDNEIKELHFKGTVPPALTKKSSLDNTSYDTFSHFSFEETGAKIYVPSASVDAYKKADVWSEYANYIVGE